MYSFADINECTKGTHTCDKQNGYCVNSEGSFTCSCNVGYTGNGFLCTGWTNWID